jgi:15-cis-phytoene synthase
MSDQEAIDAAYRHCEAVTREQAANFYYGIRLLSGERRRAMCAVYAFARRVDDIGDGTLPRERKLTLLEQERDALRLLGERDPRAAAGGEWSRGADPAQEDPVMLALADARARFRLPLDALEDLLDGVLMDLDGVRYESFEELVLYCRRVAGAIGRVSLAIFGLRHGEGADPVLAAELADDLGVALQLTNILRDIREDAGNGRVYLPGEDLRRFGLPDDGSGAAAALLAAAEARSRDGSPQSGELPALVRFEAARAQGWFARGLALAPMLDRRSAACVLAMAGIYRRLLERIEADPAAALSRRASLPVHEKAWVAARGLLGIAP